MELDAEAQQQQQQHHQQQCHHRRPTRGASNCESSSTTMSTTAISSRPISSGSDEEELQPLTRQGQLQQSSNVPSTTTSTTTATNKSLTSRFPIRIECMNSTRLMVLAVLCLQNSIFTVLRRYSVGVLREEYSKHEVLLVGEVMKILYSVWMISEGLAPSSSHSTSGDSEDMSTGSSSQAKMKTLIARLKYLVLTSKKMFVLALIYGAMNILSFVALQNISAGIFTIIAQCKILTTATFSSIILGYQYSWAKWRALISLMLGVLLFSEPIWRKDTSFQAEEGANPFLGVMSVVIEVTLSGFASIYFEKVIKLDPLKLNIWERNFQLALGSFPVYLVFIARDATNSSEYEGLFHGWSFVAFLLSMLGAAGGLLVALSIKYGDSVLKTFATSGAIVLSSVLDHVLLGGPLSPTMMIAGIQVIIAITNYTFDAAPVNTRGSVKKDADEQPVARLRPTSPTMQSNKA